MSCQSFIRVLWYSHMGYCVISQEVKERVALCNRVAFEVEHTEGHIMCQYHLTSPRGKKCKVLFTVCPYLMNHVPNLIHWCPVKHLASAKTSSG